MFEKQKGVLEFFFFFQAEDGIRYYKVTGVQTCALPILPDGGAMAAVSAAAEKVEEALRGREDVEIGAYNGADTVVSGGRQAVDAVIEHFEAQAVWCRRLVTSH